MKKFQVKKALVIGLAMMGSKKLSQGTPMTTLNQYNKEQIFFLIEDNQCLRGNNGFNPMITRKSKYFTGNVYNQME